MWRKAWRISWWRQKCPKLWLWWRFDDDYDRVFIVMQFLVRMLQICPTAISCPGLYFVFCSHALGATAVALTRASTSASWASWTVDGIFLMNFDKVFIGFWWSFSEFSIGFQWIEKVFNLFPTTSMNFDKFLVNKSLRELRTIMQETTEQSVRSLQNHPPVPLEPPGRLTELIEQPIKFIQNRLKLIRFIDNLLKTD